MPDIRPAISVIDDRYILIRPIGNREVYVSGNLVTDYANLDPDIANAIDSILDLFEDGSNEFDGTYESLSAVEYIEGKPHTIIVKRKADYVGLLDTLYVLKYIYLGTERTEVCFDRSYLESRSAELSTSDGFTNITLTAHRATSVTTPDGFQALKCEGLEGYYSPVE